MASSDLVNMGISVVSYTLKDIHDDQVSRAGVLWVPAPCSTLCRTAASASLPQDYLHSLGKARTAQVQKDARIGEAEAKRDAGIRVSGGRGGGLWSPWALEHVGGVHHDGG